MKNVVLSVLALLFCSAVSMAQNREKRTVDEYFYTSAEMVFSNGFKKDDISTIDLGVRMGWRIDRNWSLFVPADISLLLYNRSTTRNYNADALLGLGLSRRFFLKAGDSIELSAQYSSTFAPAPMHYMKPSIMVRYSLSEKSCLSRFYGGLGGHWLHPYNNAAQDRFLLSVSIGVWFL